MEHDWNPFVDLQAMDRVHRIGQTLPVTIYRLVAENSIETRVLALQQIKKIVAAEVINDENAGTGSSDELNNAPLLGNAIWQSLQTTPNILSVHNTSSSNSNNFNNEMKLGQTNDDTEEIESYDIDAFLTSMGV